MVTNEGRLPIRWRTVSTDESEKFERNDRPGITNIQGLASITAPIIKLVSLINTNHCTTFQEAYCSLSCTKFANWIAEIAAIQTCNELGDEQTSSFIYRNREASQSRAEANKTQTRPRTSTHRKNLPSNTYEPHIKTPSISILIKTRHPVCTFYAANYVTPTRTKSGRPRCRGLRGGVANTIHP